jgi:hypothetical protein
VSRPKSRFLSSGVRRLGAEVTVMARVQDVLIGVESIPGALTEIEGPKIQCVLVSIGSEDSELRSCVELFDFSSTGVGFAIEAWESFGSDGCWVRLQRPDTT